MKTKFTKGEWYFVDYASHIEIQDGEFYEDNNILDYGDILNENNPITEEEAIANAVLMCAAPDLLEACIQALRFVDIEESAYNLLTKAIKKATK